jgi:hypothetical protein
MPVTQERRKNLDTELQDIKTQLAVIIERLNVLSDHEGRIRELEKGRADIKTELGEINQRIGIFNLAQASFTGVMAFLAYYWKK